MSILVTLHLSDFNKYDAEEIKAMISSTINTLKEKNVENGDFEKAYYLRECESKLKDNAKITITIEL